MSPADDLHVAIIGAGYAGCAAAVELARAGVPLSVFEASQQLGGRARGVEKDGWRVDNGQHLLIGAYTETLRLLRSLGVSPKRFETRPFHLHIPGRLDLRAAELPAPLHLALGLLRARGLDWADRKAAPALLRLLKRQGFVIAPDCTVSELLERSAQTPRLRELVWEPLCLAALNTPAREASAQVFANVLRDSLAAGAGASQLLLPRIDLSELLPVPAVLYLSRRNCPVHTATMIRAIEHQAEGFVLQGDPFLATYSHVIIATAPWQALDLLAPFPELAQLRRQLASLEYEPITTAYVAYDAPLRLPQPMLALPAGATVQWLFDRGQFGGPAGLFAGVISARGPHSALPREEIALKTHEAIESLLGRQKPPHWSQVITEKRATFACRPGLRRPISLTPVRNLLLAGDYIESDYPATLESAVRAGLGAARQILRQQRRV